MNEMMYQGIFDSIENTLPDDWSKVVLYANYSEGSYSIKYYVKESSNQYKDCYALNGISKPDLIKIFMNIDKCIAPERKKLSDKDKWSVMTLIVEKAGGFKAEYEYKDLSNILFEYEASWKKKYLA